MTPEEEVEYGEYADHDRMDHLAATLPLTAERLGEWREMLDMALERQCGYAEYCSDNISPTLAMHRLFDEIERLRRITDEQRIVIGQMADEVERKTNWLAFLDATTGACNPYDCDADVLPWIAAQPEAQLIDGIPNGGGAK